MCFSDLWVGFFGGFVLFSLSPLFVCFQCNVYGKKKKQQYCGICPAEFSWILGLVSCFPTMFRNVTLSPYITYTLAVKISTLALLFLQVHFIPSTSMCCQEHICMIVIILVNGLPVHDRGLLSIFSRFVTIKPAWLRRPVAYVGIPFSQDWSS